MENITVLVRVDGKIKRIENASVDYSDGAIGMIRVSGEYVKYNNYHHYYNFLADLHNCLGRGTEMDPLEKFPETWPKIKYTEKTSPHWWDIFGFFKVDVQLEKLDYNFVERKVLNASFDRKYSPQHLEIIYGEKVS